MKILKIKFCSDCTFREGNDSTYDYYCTNPGLSLQKQQTLLDDEIPEWCPLEDYSKNNTKFPSSGEEYSCGCWGAGCSCRNINKI